MLTTVGAAIGTNNGRYTTDRNGLITITGLQPGQVLIVTEEKAPDGYVKDATPKTIKIKQDVANSLIFENAHAGSLVINKRSSADKKTPLQGVTFKITTTSGEFLPDENGKISSNGLYYTDENGQITLKSVVGTLVVTEVETIDGFHGFFALLGVYLFFLLSATKLHLFPAFSFILSLALTFRSCQPVAENAHGGHAGANRLRQYPAG